MIVTGLDYLGQARAVFAGRGLSQQVQQLDAQMAHLSGAPDPIAVLLAGLPPTVRAALEQQDGTALAAALDALPEDEAAAIVAHLRQAGILGPPPAPPDMERVLEAFAPLLQAIAAVAQGDETAKADILAALAQHEAKGWHLTAAVTALWAGERDPAVLTHGLDDQDASLIDAILVMLATPADAADESPPERS